MQQAGLVEKTKRAHLRITSEGQKVLALKLVEIDNKYLAGYPSFREKVLKPNTVTAGQAEDLAKPVSLRFKHADPN